MSTSFFGREKEIAWLRGEFEACAARAADGKYAGPRMAFVIAESGIGKSRLVQELYLQLAADPKWDPPEADYWPDSFREIGSQLRTVPDMTGHVPKGPPRFAWLGARWTAIATRNVQERRSILSELRSAIMVHAEILNSHRSLWADASGRLAHAIKHEGVEETVQQIADHIVPFGSLLTKLAKGAKELVSDRLTGPRSFSDIFEEAAATAVDEVMDCLRLLLHGGGAVPTVLWLDDAQWIDGETMELLRRLWLAASQQRWPLLIIVTHWEREWRELAAARRQGHDESAHLQDYEGKPGVGVLHFGSAPISTLEDYLQARLPGLSANQRALLLEKAAGNFLSMVENVGELLKQPGNFVGRDLRAALSLAGERKVALWESERQKRVEQRFGDLEPEIQDLLGWGSHLGVRFLHEVVSEFAVEITASRESPALLERCVDPYVILGCPTKHLREFRDKAFHQVAGRHFENYGAEHTAALSRVLQNHLIAWINNSFDNDGDTLSPGTGNQAEQPVHRAIDLAAEERRDLLGMAQRELPLPDSPDWANPRHVAALRSISLMVLLDGEEKKWPSVAEGCLRLEAVRWIEVPEVVCAERVRQQLQFWAWRGNAWSTVAALAEASLARSRRLADKLGTPESRDDLASHLGRIAHVEQFRGNLHAALIYYTESLKICRHLVDELGTSDSRWNLGDVLYRVAYIEESRGNDDSAFAHYTESREICRRLADELGTLDGWMRLSHLLRSMGRFEQARGRLDSAYTHYTESLEICRRHVGKYETMVGWFNLRKDLDRMAEFELTRGHLDSARACYAESLEIIRRCADETGTPQSRRDLAFSLLNVASVEHDLGDLGSALRHRTESLEIVRRLAAELGTPESQRDLGSSLYFVARTLQARGDLDSALTLFDDCLRIFRRLKDVLDSPAVWRGLGLTLSRVAAIEQARGNLDAARANITESLEIAHRLADEHGTPESKEILHHVKAQLEEVGAAIARRSGGSARGGQPETRDNAG